MRNLILAAIGGVPVMLGSTSVLAQPSDQQPPAIRSLIDCRSINDNNARLACYDERVGEIAAATERKELVVMDRDAVRKTRRSLFGFTLPRLPFLGGGQEDDSRTESKDEGSSNSLEAEVKSVRSLGYDKWAFVLDDGARWETTEALGGRDPKAGGTVHIKRGALGSYMAQFDGGRWVRARRIN